MAGGTNVTQVPATVAVVIAAAEDVLVVGPTEGVELAEPEDVPGEEVARGVVAVPGAGLALASGAVTAPGAVEQVATTVVTGTGLGVGVVLPIGAAVPLVDSAGLANEVAEFDDAWLGLVIGDWLGFVGVVRLGGVMLL